MLYLKYSDDTDKVCYIEKSEDGIYKIVGEKNLVTTDLSYLSQDYLALVIQLLYGYIPYPPKILRTELDTMFYYLIANNEQHIIRVNELYEVDLKNLYDFAFFNSNNKKFYIYTKPKSNRKYITLSYENYNLLTVEPLAVTSELSNCIRDILNNSSEVTAYKNKRLDMNETYAASNVLLRWEAACCESEEYKFFVCNLVISEETRNSLLYIDGYEINNQDSENIIKAGFII